MRRMDNVGGAGYGKRSVGDPGKYFFLDVHSSY